MHDSAWFNLVAGTLAIGVVVFGAFAVASPLVATPPPASHSSQGANPTNYRNLSISFNPTSGTYDYSSIQLAVPVGVTTIFTITNYDQGIAWLPSASDARVVGTVGGTMQLTISGQTAQVSSVATNDVSHTFTILSGAYHVSVPIPPASPNGEPSKVTFSVVFSVPGTFNWGCVVLCGPAGMMARDAMYGTLTVS
jgi:hypothetical protein